MKQKQREIYAKLYDYSYQIGMHRPNIGTPFLKYREAMNCISNVLLANFGVWDKGNPHQEQDQRTIQENIEKLEAINNEFQNL